MAGLEAEYPGTPGWSARLARNYITHIGLLESMQRRMTKLGKDLEDDPVCFLDYAIFG